MQTSSRRDVLRSTAAAALLSGLPLGAARSQTAAQAPAKGDTEWRTFAGDLAHTRYSPLDQINADNFSKLELAWRVRTDKFGPRPEGALESTPLLIKGRLFSTAGTRRSVVSMDAETGEILWVHRLDEGERALRAPRQKSGRGVSYWTDGTVERILYVTVGYQLVALDATTGQRVSDFGTGGVVDLKRNIDQDLDVMRADLGLHATPLVVGDVIVVGAAHLAGDAPPARRNPRGYVRGFDVRTGKRLWIFHTIPLKGEFGYDTWLDGSENAGNGGVWAQMSADEALGLVYIGVEMPTGDYMGQYRRGDGLFGESIVALDFRTGERKWHYQLVRHGLWDYDIPCAATLCDIPHKGKIVKALAQPSKQGWLYVLNRETGEPIWPIVDKRVPKGDVPGEWYAKTQPFPTKPPPYERHNVNVDELIDFTPELRAKAVERLKLFKSGPIYTPPSLAKPGGPFGTLMGPGLQGGTNWPGASYDPETYKLYVYSKLSWGLMGLSKNNNPMASEFEYVRAQPGQQVRPQLGQGAQPGAFPGRPPGVPDNAKDVPPDPVAEADRSPGVLIDGLPMAKPPWGRLTAIDLSVGDISWSVAHGATPDMVRDHPALKGLDIPRTGHAANLGPLTTKTLVIIGDGITTTDAKGKRGAMLRAYDKATGQEVASLYMPAQQNGCPMTYMLKGRQYIVLGIGNGGAYPAEFVAFRLPGARAAGPVRDGGEG